MQKPNQSREEYIAELKKKYGELEEPTEFDDEIYIKVEEARQEYNERKYYTVNQIREKMKKEFEMIRKDKKFQTGRIIAEKNERYNNGV